MCFGLSFVRFPWASDAFRLAAESQVSMLDSTCRLKEQKTIVLQCWARAWLARRRANELRKQKMEREEFLQQQVWQENPEGRETVADRSFPAGPRGASPETLSITGNSSPVAGLV